MKATVESDAVESIESEDALYGNDEHSYDKPCYTHHGGLSKKGRNKSKDKRHKEFDDNEIVNLNSDKYKGIGCVDVEESTYERATFEEDRVLHTSFKLSPYAINLMNMVKLNQKTKKGEAKIMSRPKVVLLFTSSTIDKFYNLMIIRYNTISSINKLALEINASSGKVSIMQPKLKIDMSKEDEDERIDALILSGVLTKIKMLSEEFGVSVSYIVEYLLYLYVYDNKDGYSEEIKKYCKERMDSFIELLDSFISSCTSLNTEDENALIRIAYKMTASDIKEKTFVDGVIKRPMQKTIDIEVYDGFNINAVVKIRRKMGKSVNINGIFKKKSGRRLKSSENFGD